jgi:hypothetical protein
VATSRALLLSAHLILGCAASPGDDLNVARAAITAGLPSSRDLEVVGIIANERVVCTGTLVHPRVVLTAAHCLAIEDSLSVFFGAQYVRGEPTIRTVEKRPHPEFEPRTLANDVGLLLLEEKAPPEAPIARLDERPLDDSVVGTEVRVVGFGAERGGESPLGAKKTGRALVAAVNRWEVRLSPGPALTCSGDSGGPVFLAVGGAETLVGVTSAGDAACTSVSVATRVDGLLGSFITPYLESVPDDGAEVSGGACAFEGHHATCSAWFLAACVALILRWRSRNRGARFGLS